MMRLFLLFVLVVLAAPVFAVRFTVSDIRLEGLQRVSASPVFAALPVRVGDTVDSERLRQSAREIFATGFFTDIEMARDGDVLVVVLHERPSIKSIGIEGNKAIKTEQLREIMSENGLSEGEILQRYTLQGITRELERQYVSRARYGAVVDAKVEELANNTVEIKLDVDEGRSAKIKHVNIVGNSAFSDKTLRRLFELRPSHRFFFLSSRDQYAKEKLKGDIETLESFYLDRGYLDFNIVSSQISISPDKRGVYITLNVSEGDVYKVNDVELAGELVLKEETVRRLILLSKGDTFSQGKMTGTSEYIETLLGNSGYTNAKVEGIPNKNPDDNTVDLSFFIDPGKRVYVRRIEFRGNVKTSDEVLRRELRQLEGASASNARIEQSKVRLDRLGFFKEVTVETKDVPGTTDLVDVEYTVEEQPSGSVSATLGYADRSGLQLGLNLQQNNWLGTGKQVGFAVNENNFETAYNFSYNDPYFTPDGVSRGFRAYYRKRDYSSLGTSRFSTDTYGLGVNFGYPISEIARLNFGLGYANQSLTVGRNAPQEFKAAPYLFDGYRSVYVTQTDYEASILRGTSGEFQLQTSPVTASELVDTTPGFIDKFGDEFDSATFNLSWSRFTLNRGILATRGNSQVMSLEATVPGSDLEYFKITYDAQAFVPLSRAFTLRFKTSLGYGDGYGDFDELPFFENFFGGGFGSVRGFERSSLGPKVTPPQSYLTTHTGWQDLDRDGLVDPVELTDTLILGNNSSGFLSLPTAYVVCEDPSRSLNGRGAGLGCEPGRLVTDPIFVDARNSNFGGNILTEFSTELLLPIPFVEDTRSMQLSAFVDAGNVFSSSCRETQQNCTNLDFEKLSSSFGFGFTWISGFGPMTFSIAKPLNKNERDRTEVFQFSFGAGF